MIHLHLTKDQYAYDEVADIIKAEAEKVIKDYYPCSFIVRIGYKYDWEKEEDRTVENIYYYDNAVFNDWETDWCEGQTDIIIYGFTTIEEVKVLHRVGECEVEEAKEWYFDIEDDIFNEMAEMMNKKLKLFQQYVTPGRLKEIFQEAKKYDFMQKNKAYIDTYGHKSEFTKMLIEYFSKEGKNET